MKRMNKFWATNTIKPAIQIKMPQQKQMGGC